MKNRWVVKKGDYEEKAQAISQQLNIPTSLGYLLVQKGIYTYEEAKSFFRPSLTQLHDPFLMKGMDKSVSRIEKAITENEKVLIFGDYDVDGTSAVALVYSFLKQFDIPLEYYIPDRYNEGYGLSTQAIEYAHENNFTLIITLDCGIKCHHCIHLANQHQIDVIVCDHHLPDETLPDAYAILDPKQKDCPYPYKELSGCGVGFKFVQAIAKNRNMPDEKVFQYLDLVAISIASDIVLITGENRILAYYGLKLINTRPRQGVEAILAFSNIIRKKDPGTYPEGTIYNKKITINDLVFLVGPRINAAGRMDTGRKSVHLLISDQETKTTELGELIDARNSERRELDIKTTIEAIEQVKKNQNYHNKRSLVVYNPHWSKGVIGIVASRLVEEFYKPSITLTLDNGLLTGSARSVKGFDLYNALCKCSSYLEHFGGHPFAAGLSLKPGNLFSFTEAFEEAVASSTENFSTIPEIEIDKEINLNEINELFYNVLNQFAPFGPESMEPVFMTKNVLDNGKARIVGKEHLQLSVFQTDVRSLPINAIAFGFKDKYTEIKKGTPFHICYNIKLNYWNGRSSIQLMIKDIKFDSSEII